MQRQWTEVADIVNAAVARTRRAFPDRQIGLRMPKLLPMIRTDGVLLEQVLFNLVENAMKFSPAEKPVSVAVRKDAEQLWLSVIDEGPSIDAEQLPVLFERFRRGSHERSSVAGLGLSICKAIVDALGGELEVESPRRGRRVGTAVHVRLALPLSQPEHC
jgi:two-component system, OmpR family, sensor histidine kinase KdpD